MHVTDGCFSYLNKTQRKICFVVGAKQFLYKTEIFIVRFGKIRYEISARVADGLRIYEFYNSWCEEGLNSLLV